RGPWVVELVGQAKSADAAYGRPALLNGEEAAICAAATISSRIGRAPWIGRPWRPTGLTLFAVVPDIGGEFPIALYSLPQDKIFSGNLLWRRSLGRQAEGADFARCGRTQAFHFQGGQLWARDLLRHPFPHRSNCGAASHHRRAGRKCDRV